MDMFVKLQMWVIKVKKILLYLAIIMINVLYSYMGRPNIIKQVQNFILSSNNPTPEYI